MGVLATGGVLGRSCSTGSSPEEELEEKIEEDRRRSCEVEACGGVGMLGLSGGVGLVGDGGWGGWFVPVSLPEREAGS